MSQVCSFREGSGVRRGEGPKRVSEVATYANGRPYSPARGRSAERAAVEDRLERPAVAGSNGAEAGGPDAEERRAEGRELRARVFIAGMVTPDSLHALAH